MTETPSFTPPEHRELRAFPLKSEVLQKPHRLGLIMPYSSTLNDKGEAKLSRFSYLATFAAYKAFVNGDIDKLVLCGERTFPDAESTTQLQIKALLDLSKEDPQPHRPLLPEDIIAIGDSNLAQDIEKTGIRGITVVTAKARNLNNTRYQIQAVSDYQRDHGLSNEPFLVIGWHIHDFRLLRHMKEFSLNGDIINVETLIDYYAPEIDITEEKRVLEGYKKRELIFRLVAVLDRKGRIPELVTAIRGATVMDIKNRKLEYTTSKKKARSVRNTIKKVQAKSQQEPLSTGK